MTIAEQLEARGEARGMARGEAQGAKKSSRLIATNLIKLWLSNEVIVQSTGLTVEEVLELR